MVKHQIIGVKGNNISYPKQQRDIKKHSLDLIQINALYGNLLPRSRMPLPGFEWWKWLIHSYLYISTV